MHVILQVMESFSKLQSKLWKWCSLSPISHLLSFLSCFRWEWNSEKLPVFPERLSTSPKTKVVRPSCSRPAVPVWKLLITGFYHFFLWISLLVLSSMHEWQTLVEKTWVRGFVYLHLWSHYSCIRVRSNLVPSAGTQAKIVIKLIFF